MIIALVAAFQLAASAAPLESLTVRDASRSAVVALVPSDGGSLLRADQLRPIVPVIVSHVTGSRWMLIVGGQSIEIEEGTRFAKAGGQTYQLATAPQVRKQALYVPLQLIAEILPRVAGNLAWDPARFELRAFSTPDKYARVSDSNARKQATPVLAQTVAPGPLRTRRLVVVDAGHGGPDGGMHGPLGFGPDVREKDVTLAVAKRVGAALNERGIDVTYTRTTDTLIALSDRGRIANEARADLFVSIHVNAANPGWKDPGGARGFETYFLSEAKTEDARRVERMENEVVKFESSQAARAGDPLSFILNDMAQNEHLRESNELAELIQRRMGVVHPGPNRGVKQAGFRVLVTAFMPAVLVEIGFGTNPGEAAYMTSPARMNELSGAIADGVLEYLRRYERRVSSTGSAAGGQGQR